MFLGPATPREELASFIFMRSIVFSANLEFDEAYRTCKIASELSPKHPGYKDELDVIEGYKITKQFRSCQSWLQLPECCGSFRVPNLYSIILPPESST